MQMGEWPFWLVGAALAGAMLIHWWVTRRMFAGSGRFTALIDFVRQGPPKEKELSMEEMIAAMREMTAQEYGTEAVEELPNEAPPAPSLAPTLKPVDHVIFLIGIMLGGTLAVFVGGGEWTASTQMQSALFIDIFGDSPGVAAAVLAFGGVLVGFGTRMAGGCTTGHGLCGVSRFQIGSIVSTCAFFGGGVVVSLTLGAFLS
jgi:hypothetical protein